MASGIKIRLAAEGDSASILQMYAPFISDTVITFECEIPTEQDFKRRITNIQRKYPWLVCEIEDKIVGYAYASTFNERNAYDWSADFSIYIRTEYQRKNIGKALYFSLIEIMKLQGYCNIFVGVALPNIKSESFHESYGFKAVGIYEKAGYKLGGWHDVKWYGLKIGEHGKAPIKPKPIAEVSNTDEFRAILEKAELLIDNMSITLEK